MSTRRITRSVYDAMVDAYREKPGSISYAARITGTTNDTAKRGWEAGWVKKFSWALPIREVLAKERESARAARQRMEDEQHTRATEDRDKARQDAVKTRAQEAQAAKIVRTNAIAHSQLSSKLIMAAIPLADRLGDSLKTAQLDPLKAVRIIRDIGIFAKQANDATLVALQIERARVGEPIELLDGMASTMDMTQAVESLERLHRTLDRARLHGIDVSDIPTDAYEDVDDDEDDDEDMVEGRGFDA